MLQIDGLTYTQLLRAMKKNRLPFLSHLMKAQSHHLQPFYSGMPSTTPAVQAELFYGVKSAVPAFQFIDRSRSQTFTMGYTWSADHVAQGLPRSSGQLLSGGRSYANIFTGGADQARYCVQTMRLDSLLKAMNPLRLSALLLCNLGKLVSIAGYATVELIMAVFDFLRGVIRQKAAARKLVTEAHIPLVMSTVLVIALCALAVFHWMKGGRFDLMWQHLINEQTHSGLFIGLFLILPLLGFPISIFLVLLGVKYDTGTSVLIMSGGMAFHLILSYPAANTFLRPVIERILTRTRFELPQFSHKGFIAPSLIFMAVPGLSYTMKNYILSLSGIHFWAYFIIGWFVQASMGIPVVIAGDIIQRRYLWRFLPLFVLGFAIYALYHWKQSRRR